MNKFFRALLISATLCTLSACMVGPDYEAAEVSLPEHWVLELEQSQQQRQHEWQHWWQQFNDPVLEGLVVSALEQNLELRAQYERINEARAQLGFADAERFPTIGYQAQASRERLPGTALPIDNEMIQELIQTTYTTYTVSATLAYELDLWGRVTRQREGAAASVGQRAYDFEAARLSLIADVVTTYIELRATAAQYQSALQIVADYEDALELQQLRFAEGQVAELVVQQTRTELATARADLPRLRAQRSGLESAMAILLGLNPQQVFSGFEEGLHHTRVDDMQLPEQLPNLIPAELLERRPDILAAEQGVRAAVAQAGVAEADRLPRISIQGFFGTVATSSSDLFSSNSRAWGLTGDLAGPLLDFGRLAAGVDIANVQMRLATTQYEAIVNAAYVEVRDALNFYEQQLALYDALLDQQRSIERQLDMVTDAYAIGLVSYLDVLDARRGYANAIQALASARGQLLSASATLFKALGGDWQSTQDRDQVASNK